MRGVVEELRAFAATLGGGGMGRWIDRPLNGNAPGKRASYSFLFFTSSNISGSGKMSTPVLCVLSGGWFSTSPNTKSHGSITTSLIRLPTGMRYRGGISS